MQKEKHVMNMTTSEGRTVGILLCTFCERTETIRKAEDCPYYEEQYEGATCPGHIHCRDDNARLREVLGNVDASCFFGATD